MVYLWIEVGESNIDGVIESVNAYCGLVDGAIITLIDAPIDVLFQVMAGIVGDMQVVPSFKMRGYELPSYAVGLSRLVDKMVLDAESWFKTTGVENLDSERLAGVLAPLKCVWHLWPLSVSYTRYNQPMISALENRLPATAAFFNTRISDVQNIAQGISKEYVHDPILPAILVLQTFDDTGTYWVGKQIPAALAHISGDVSVYPGVARALKVAQEWRAAVGSTQSVNTVAETVISSAK